MGRQGAPCLGEGGLVLMCVRSGWRRRRRGCVFFGAGVGGCVRGATPTTRHVQNGVCACACVCWEDMGARAVRRGKKGVSCEGMPCRGGRARPAPRCARVWVVVLAKTRKYGGDGLKLGFWEWEGGREGTAFIQANAARKRIKVWRPPPPGSSKQASKQASERASEQHKKNRQEMSKRGSEGGAERSRERGASARVRGAARPGRRHYAAAAV